METYEKHDNEEKAEEEVIAAAADTQDSIQMEDNKEVETTNQEETVPVQQEEPIEEANASSQEEPKEEPPVEEEKKGTSKKKKQPKGFMKKHKSGLIATSCFVLAGVGGFGGTMVALQMSDGSGKTVMYQSVDKNTSSSNGNDANATSMSVKQIANETMNSVVEIKTEGIQTNEYFQQAVTSGAGSGVILTEDGYIVTNNHVIEDASKITVTTKDGKSYEAKLIGTDTTTDLAVIKIEATGLTPAVQGDSSKLEVGDAAIAIGNPLGSLGGTVTNGIVSALDREITIDNETMHLLQTNAAINPGNSGGGLFNDQGELIGIVNAKSSGSNIEGLGFAIPINIAKPVISSIIENGYVTGRPELGVSLIEANTNSNPFSNNKDSETAVYINSVQSGKSADNAGLKRGDRILEVDGKTVSEIADVKSCVSSHKAGEVMTIKIDRDGKQQTIKVTLLEKTTATTEKTSYQQ